MIDKREVHDVSSTWQVPDETIERDYSLGWLLRGIAQDDTLLRSLVFRGGTCLKKCYVDTHRFSEDLDFAVFERSRLDLELLQDHLPGVLRTTTEISGIDFLVREPLYELSASRQAIHVKVYFRGPRDTPTPISIKLDIELEEPIVRPPVLRKIGHPYSDQLPPSDTVYCYGLEELFAEKLRALGERYRPRDLYDTIYLFRRSDVHAEASLVLEILAAKCEAKGIPLPAVERLRSPECSEELRAHWMSMLGHQLGHLPGFDDYFQELDKLFAWLEGKPLPPEDLLPIAAGDQWLAPPIEWRPGQQERLEPVRFAAVNRLCVDLGYDNSQRVIEPYSLRHTQAGNLLLFGIRSDNRELRAYRVDKIQSISVTSSCFKPVHRVEFTPQGRFSAPATGRPSRIGVPRARRAKLSKGFGGSSTTYVIQCPYCGKRFRRSTYDLSLKPHKDPRSKLRCPGSFAIHIRTE